jgi:hypothetical protein
MRDDLHSSNDAYAKQFYLLKWFREKSRTFCYEVISEVYMGLGQLLKLRLIESLQLKKISCHNCLKRLFKFTE